MSAKHDVTISINKVYAGEKQVSIIHDTEDKLVRFHIEPWVDLKGLKTYGYDNLFDAHRYDITIQIFVSKVIEQEVIINLKTIVQAIGCLRIVNAKQNRLTPLHMDLDKKKTLKITGLTKIIIFMSLKLRARQINETLMGKDFWIKKRRRQNRGEQSLSGENSTTFAERIKMSKSEASTKRTRPVVSKMKKAKKLRMSSSTKDRPEEFENYDDGLST
ncbi:uncharacterized protein HKW66_Vig0042040 [Vigna angularis]|uniref:Uncharacterized protein n=1 Tax=Phaseolus angularis TaxID=3914 RepID=A0A8T0KZT0_PHAAN|nr:uncharacterized protein HKW66_Vig0042040 [Vigna angularis]